LFSFKIFLLFFQDFYALIYLFLFFQIFILSIFLRFHQEKFGFTEVVEPTYTDNLLIHPSSPLSNRLFRVIHHSNTLLKKKPSKGCFIHFKGDSSLRVLANTLFGCFCSPFLRVTHPHRVSQFDNYSRHLVVQSP